MCTDLLWVLASVYVVVFYYTLLVLNQSGMHTLYIATTYVYWPALSFSLSFWGLIWTSSVNSSCGHVIHYHHNNWGKFNHVIATCTWNIQLSYTYHVCLDIYILHFVNCPHWIEGQQVFQGRWGSSLCACNDSPSQIAQSGGRYVHSIYNGWW